MTTRPYRIGIVVNTLPNQEISPSIALLEEAIQSAGQQSMLIRPCELNICVRDDKAMLLHGDREVNSQLPNVIINRHDVTTITDHDIQVMREYELLGVPLVNSMEKVMRVHDKFGVSRLLMAVQIPFPSIARLGIGADVEQVIQFLGGFPVVLKANQSNCAKAVLLIANSAQLKSIRDFLTYANAQTDYFLQSYVQEATECCMRAVVIDGKIVVAYGFKPPKDEFRANLSLQGTFTGFVEVAPDEAAMFIKIADILGLEVVGIDFVRTKGGVRVIDVNPSPGLANLYKQGKFDLAPFFVQAALQMAEGKHVRP